MHLLGKEGPPLRMAYSTVLALGHWPAAEQCAQQKAVWLCSSTGMLQERPGHEAPLGDQIRVTEV
jgi:hypothetical protein